MLKLNIKAFGLSLGIVWQAHYDVLYVTPLE
jgi:hypothetical protein